MSRITILISIIVFLFGSGVFLFPPFAFSSDAAPDVFHIGVYENFPLSQWRSGDKPEGFFIDVWEMLASRENIRYEYVKCTLSECLDKTRSGQLEATLVVADTPARRDAFDFLETPVFSNWASVYTRKSLSVESILDLSGKKVALEDGDIHGAEFRRLAQNFNLAVEIVPARSFRHVFQLISDGSVDAGVVARTFGQLQETHFAVKRTPVIFNPVNVSIAFQRDKSKMLVAALNNDLRMLVADQNSEYHVAFAKWMGGMPASRVPSWIYAATLLSAFALLSAVGIAYFFRRQVRTKTEEICRQEARFRSIFDASNDAIFLLKDGLISEANAATAAMFGCSDVGMILGRSPADFSPSVQPQGASSLAYAQEKIASALAGAILRFEWKHKRVDGSLFDAEVILNALDLSRERVLLAIVRDITERKNYERRLLETTTLLRTIVDNAPTPILLLDADYRVQIWNPAAERVYGWTADEVIGRPLPYLDGDERERVLLEIQEASRRGEPVMYESHRKNKKGEDLAVLAASSPVMGADGGYYGIVGVHVDLSERIKAEKMMVRLTTAIEQAEEEILITDVSGTIEYVNPAFEQITGYTRNEVIGKKPSLLKSGLHDVHFYEHLWETITDGRVWKGRFKNRRKDGTLLQEDAIISPIVDGSGAITGYVSLKRDITDELKREAQFMQAQKMDAVGRLAGGVAHDFNNLLTAIVGYASFIIQLAKTSEKKDDYARSIIDVANRAAALTKSLLVFSRKQEADFARINMHDVVNDFLKLIGRIIGEDIKVITRMEGTSLPVMGNAGQLGQVLLNLATNARDAMTYGGAISIESRRIAIDDSFVALHGMGSAGHYIVTSLSDTGSGMVQSQLKEIFEPFFTTKEAGKGTGLGLSIVFGIVQAHGGFISVYSEVGVGTTFRVYLPECMTGEQYESDTFAGETPGGSETILVAEDDEMIHHILTHTLKSAGYRVISCRNGAEAHNIYQSQGADIALILSDVVMPKMNGKALYDVVQSSRPGVKFLFLSGYTSDILEDRIHLEINVDVMYKPISPIQLLRRIRTILDS